MRAVIAQLAAEERHDSRQQHVLPLPQPLHVLLGLGPAPALGRGRLQWLLVERVVARLLGWGGGGGVPVRWRRRGSEHKAQRLGHGGDQLRRIGGGVPVLLVVREAGGEECEVVRARPHPQRPPCTLEELQHLRRVGRHLCGLVSLKGRFE